MKLKPCPFCNGVLKEDGGEPWDQEFKIICTNCFHIWKFGYTREEIINKWYIKQGEINNE